MSEEMMMMDDYIRPLTHEEVMALGKEPSDAELIGWLKYLFLERQKGDQPTYFNYTADRLREITSERDTAFDEIERLTKERNDALAEVERSEAVAAKYLAEVARLKATLRRRANADKRDFDEEIDAAWIRGVNAAVESVENTVARIGWTADGNWRVILTDLETMRTGPYAPISGSELAQEADIQSALLCAGGCGRLYSDGPDVVIPDEAWLKIAPRPNGGGVLCPNCMDDRLRAAGYDYGDAPGFFMSGPMAMRDLPFHLTGQDDKRTWVVQPVNGVGQEADTPPSPVGDSAEPEMAVSGHRCVLDEHVLTRGFMPGWNQCEHCGYSEVEITNSVPPKVAAIAPEHADGDTVAVEGEYPSPKPLADEKPETVWLPYKPELGFGNGLTPDEKRLLSAGIIRFGEMAGFERQHLYIAPDTPLKPIATDQRPFGHGFATEADRLAGIRRPLLSVVGDGRVLHSLKLRPRPEPTHLATEHADGDTVAISPCTCHPDDNPPRPCPRKYALTECRLAAIASKPLATDQHPGNPNIRSAPAMHVAGPTTHLHQWSDTDVTDAGCAVMRELVKDAREAEEWDDITDQSFTSEVDEFMRRQGKWPNCSVCGKPCISEPYVATGPQKARHEQCLPEGLLGLIEAHVRENPGVLPSDILERFAPYTVRDELSRMLRVLTQKGLVYLDAGAGLFARATDNPIGRKAEHVGCLPADGDLAVVDPLGGLTPMELVDRADWPFAPTDECGRCGTLFAMHDVSKMTTGGWRVTCPEADNWTLPSCYDTPAGPVRVRGADVNIPDDWHPIDGREF